tara:strand:- start:64 stop:828 length:765 start_codon:yes stop_codon:yes gene_type:complete
VFTGKIDKLINYIKMKIVMTITLKLVGVKSDLKTEIFLNWEKKEINISDIRTHFISNGYNDNISEVKFITSSETMKDEKNYSIEEDITIFVFVMDMAIKNSLIQFFNKHGHLVEKKLSTGINQQSVVVNTTQPNPELNKPLPEEQIKITSDIIDKSNQETVKLFGNQNFKTLVNIYYNNPDVFKTFASYISSGTVISSALEKNIELTYDTQLEEIKNLGLQISDEKIIEALQKFNGHINLSLRYLLTVNSIISK